ncbi:uncharacterized protein MELLADRAFT_86103 [Melampsora larici-populina 98AG31]|uniref:Uncharacterized protein n=1 Tax=Melampsora larici-populina (strain 98AG31 / pathotype 3-4-7) TaxID=747676 RepID=F4SDJ2_MELLP|nr:uncharacterized protein MELLADRAFT_86103 [Melampsora larici-populina 98AG31]EGF97285.1 hypothetical protein MELLADRAFT_86103 [Melampsora larici-populina 98AG31]
MKDVVRNNLLRPASFSLSEGSDSVPSQIMSIKIYGNLTMAKNSSITTTNIRRGRSTPAQLPNEITGAEVEANASDIELEAEGPMVDDQEVEHLPIENLALEEPPCRRGHPVPIAQPQALPRRRRSSRIARRAELRNPPRHRRPLPSVNEDWDFWSKIWTLPPNLLRYLSPGWLIDWTTRDRLRQIIWHFKPNQHIPCDALKAEIVEIFEDHVVLQYGAYYGI